MHNNTLGSWWMPFSTSVSWICWHICKLASFLDGELRSNLLQPCSLLNLNMAAKAWHKDPSGKKFRKYFTGNLTKPPCPALPRWSSWNWITWGMSWASVLAVGGSEAMIFLIWGCFPNQPLTLSRDWMMSDESQNLEMGPPFFLGSMDMVFWVYLVTNRFKYWWFFYSPALLLLYVEVVKREAASNPWSWSLVTNYQVMKKRLVTFNLLSV